MARLLLNAPGLPAMNPLHALAAADPAPGGQTITVWIIIGITLLVFGLQILIRWRKMVRGGGSGCGAGCGCGTKAAKPKPEPQRLD